MHVRLRLHDTALAACIERFVNQGTAAGLTAATRLGALATYLQTLEHQFNQALPIEDLRLATIEEARAAGADGRYADEERRFTDAVSHFLESVVVRASLWELALADEAVDPHSHVCEIRWKHDLSALAVYTDNPVTRYLTVWWMGPSSEIEQVLEMKIFR